MNYSINKKKILIVDDHPIVREGITTVLHREDDLLVIAEAEHAEAAMHLYELLSPDIVIVDLSLENSSGIDVIRQIRHLSKNTILLVISMHNESIYIEKSLKAGANGYILKREAVKQVVQAIRQIEMKGSYFSHAVGDLLAQKLISDDTNDMISPIDVLSKREYEVFKLIGNGLRRSQLANALNVSVKTIETHMQRIKTKLNLSSSNDITRYAIEWLYKSDTHHSR